MPTKPPPSDRSIDNDATEAIPHVDRVQTRPLPVVTSLPVDETAEQEAALGGYDPGRAPRPVTADGPVAPAQAAAPVPVAEAPAAAPVAEAPAAAPVAEAPAAPRITTPAPASAPAPRRRSRRLALVVALLVVAGVVVGTLALGVGGIGRLGGRAGGTGSVQVEAKVSGVDPSGGSGLQRSGDGWRTQTYRSAAFGGLKPGVGLVLDVGTARALTSVTLEATPAGATIGLRASDERPTSGADLPPVGEDVTASGRTVLEASSGGAHRYWLVWVSELGARDGGYGVTLSNPVVAGPPAR